MHIPFQNVHSVVDTNKLPTQSQSKISKNAINIIKLITAFD